MTRPEVFRDHVVRSGKIWSPGPYEGEALYVPYFWGKGREGKADALARNGDLLFLVASRDRSEYPELGSRQLIRLRQVGSSIREVAPDAER